MRFVCVVVDCFKSPPGEQPSPNEFSINLYNIYCSYGSLLRFTLVGRAHLNGNP